MDELALEPDYYDAERECRVYHLPHHVGLSIDCLGHDEQRTCTLFLDIYHPHRRARTHDLLHEEADQAWPLHEFLTLDEAHAAALAIQKVLGGTNIQEGVTRGL